MVNSKFFIKTLFVILVINSFALAGIADMAGLVAWFDAGDIAGLNDGSPVQLWQKKCGPADDFVDYDLNDGYSPSYVASSPAFNNEACLNFVNPRYDDYLISENLVSDYLCESSLTIFFVSDQKFTGFYNAGVPRLYFQGHKLTLGSTELLTCNIGYPPDETVAAIRTFSIDYSGETARGWLNGILQSTVDISSLPDLDFIYGGDGGLRAGSMHAGKIAEILIFNRELSPQELNEIGFYLKEKYDISDATYTEPASRPEAPFKVLYINDSTNVYSCQSPFQLNGQDFTDDKLRASVEEVTGKVDVHMLEFYGWVPWWNSSIYPGDQHYFDWETRTGLEASTFGQYMKNGGDVLATFIDQCEQSGQVPFASFRLNDTHHLDYLDPANPNAAGTEWLSDFLWDNIDYLLGEAGERKGLNWVYPHVPAAKLAFIEEICENYDIDGLELDFMRHEYYFDTSATTSSQRKSIMYDFVTAVREILDNTAAEGQYRWLCVRIPCLISRYDDLGIDVPAFEQAGVDMFNLSGTVYAVQHDTDLALIKQSLDNAKVYHELTQAVWVPANRNIENLDGNARDYQLYTSALNAYDRGADGISLFNFAYYRGSSASQRPYSEPPFHVLPDLGNYQSLLLKNKHWYYIADNYYPDQVPHTFTDSGSQTFDLDINKTNHLFNTDGLLRFIFEEDVDSAEWSAMVNGNIVSSVNTVLKPIRDNYQTPLGREEQYLCFDVPIEYINSGENTISLTKGSSGNAVLHYLDLIISPELYIYDLDENRSIDILDFSKLASSWLDDQCDLTDWCQRSDLNQDGIVSLDDFADFSAYQEYYNYEPVEVSLKAWYKAGSLALANAQTVETWPNAYGPAGPLLRYSGSPTYYSAPAGFSGNPAVTFDKSDPEKDYMQSSYLVSKFFDNREFTIFMISKDRYFGMANSGIPRLYMRGHQFIIGDPALTLDMGSSYTDAAIRVYMLQGQKDSTANITAWVNGANKGTVSTTAQGGLYDFGGYGHLYMPSFDSTGTVAEIIVYDTALDADQLNAVGYYLENKYGINAAYYMPSPVDYPVLSEIPVVVGED